jgi:hypothetical protein
VKTLKLKPSLLKHLAILLVMVFCGYTAINTPASSTNQTSCLGVSLNNSAKCTNSIKLISKVCGGSGNPVNTNIDFGCKTRGNPIIDMTFAIIRFLSAGVGIIVIGSVVVGGMQYIGSRGDPQATGQAIGRIRSSIIALIIFIFAYAILNYLIPVSFFNQ